MVHLGTKQRGLLRALASPSCALIVPDKVALSLVKRGLLKTEDGGFACITPAGLRVLADELESGRIEDAHEWARREREKNQASMACKSPAVT
jgi:F0F1-type ATP synthase epsilon subunit